ncbi:LysR substrate-binding domain-containing protein [Streptomyces sp. NPDC006356]
MRAPGRANHGGGVRGEGEKGCHVRSASAAPAAPAAPAAQTQAPRHLASCQTAALALVPTALGLLRDRHPHLRVHLTHMEPEKALPTLQARDFDLVLAEEYPGNPNPRPAELEQEDLLDDPLHLALPGPAGTPDADGPTAALRSLAGHPWVMEPEGTAARHWAMALCRNAGFERDVRFETTDLLLHQRLVEQGHAPAFLPGLVWSGQPPTAAPRPLPRGRRSRRIFTVVRRGRGRHPAVRACRDALLRAVALRSDQA